MTVSRLGKKPVPGKSRTGQSAKRIVAEAGAVYGRPGGEVVLYQSPDGVVTLDVKMEQETIWLTQKQMSLLFDKDTDTISLHLKNIYNEGELAEEATTEEYSVVQPEGERRVRRKLRFYNLDAVISIGYRVNSKRGTQFRIWATAVLRDHILKGYSVNVRRLEELHKTVRLIARIAGRPDLSSDETSALLKVIRDYSVALDLLDDYDHGRLPDLDNIRRTAHPLEYEEARRLIDRLRSHFSAGELFGLEKDEGLKGALAAVMQTVDGRDAYPGLEDKAAHLLYFVTKDHAFVDGNKRIAASLFLWFLQKNGVLYISEGERRISEAALVALTLMIAESRPADKEIIIRIVIRLLQGREGSV